jgi:hypothetical protein
VNKKCGNQTHTKGGDAMTKQEIKLLQLLAAIAMVAIAVMAFQKHPSSRRYWQIWLAALGLL